jgi:hypothetical protein
LSIFAIEDGKAHVAQVAMQMAIAVTEGGRFTSDDINIQLVDKWMTGNGSFSYQQEELWMMLIVYMQRVFPNLSWP